MSTNALILSGGSIKGAFQAGAIKACLEKGFAPDFIYGISVGSLNGSFLANEAGKRKLAGQTIDWTDIGKGLETFWKSNIKKPSDVAVKHGTASLVWKLIRKKFNGMLDTSAIQGLTRRSLELKNLRAEAVKLKVGAVNLYNSNIVYADPIDPAFIDYVIASTAIPVMMPGVRMGDGFFLDGGMRDVAPLGVAIDNGATDIICILCQSEKLNPVTTGFNPGSIIHFAERLMEIVVNEIVNNDVNRANEINKGVPADGSIATSGPNIGKRRVGIRPVIRPEKELDIDLEDFDSAKIDEIFEQGYDTALRIWNNPPPV